MHEYNISTKIVEDLFDGVESDIQSEVKLNSKKEKFYNTQNIEDRGFFIGIHLKKISNNELNFLEKIKLT